MALSKYWATALLATSVAHSRASPAIDVDQRQATYLVSFFKFVQWPQSPKTMSICFLRPSPVLTILKDGLEKGAPWTRVARRTLVVRLLPNVEGTEDCQMLYLDAETAKELWSQVTLQPAMLTVSDMDGFAAAGGMIQLRIEGMQLRFVVNRGRVENSGIVIGAALGSLADRLEDERQHSHAF